MKRLPERFIIAVSVVLIAWCPGFAQNKKQDTHFFFAQITDTHFGDSDYLARLEKIVDSLNALPVKIECVVLTGDISNNNMDSDGPVDAGIAVLKKLKAPLHALPGNHDILPQRLKQTVSAYKKKFGPLAHKAEYRDVVFLFVFTEPLRKRYAIDGYHPLQWLEKELKDAGEKPVLVFHHAPSVDDLYSNKLHEGWEKNTPAWRKLLTDHKVKAVIAGHFHRDEMHWIGNVPLFVAPPVTGFWGRQATYRIYEYHNGKIGYRTQYVE